MSIWTETSSDALERQHQIFLLVVQLLSGVATWDLIQSLSSDLSLLRGKRTCPRPIFCIYAVCRYVSYASIICKAIYVCILEFYECKSLLYAYESTYYISMVFAYQVFALRAVTLCNNSWVACCLAIVQLGLCVNMLLAAAHMTRSWQEDIYRPLFCAYLASASTFMSFILFLFITRACYRSTRLSASSDSRDRFSGSTLYSLLIQLHEQCVFGLVLVSAIRITAAVLCYVALDPSGELRKAFDYIAYVTTILCACRTFRTLIRKNDVHPVILMYVMKLVRARNEESVTPQHTPRRDSFPLSRLPSAQGEKPNGEIELDVFSDHAVITIKTDVTTPSGPSTSGSGSMHLP